LKLNVFKPVMIHNLLHSIRLIHDASHGFVEYCIAGMTINRRADRCQPARFSDAGHRL